MFKDTDTKFMTAVANIILWLILIVLAVAPVAALAVGLWLAVELIPAGSGRYVFVLALSLGAAGMAGGWEVVSEWVRRKPKGERNEI